jgi:hypothetical protein
MHLGRLDLTLVLKEIPAAANFSPRPDAPQVLRMSAPFPLIQSQTSARSFYLPFNKLARPSISCIPGRAIPVTEVHKWQQQPKLKQLQQQLIPSSAG